jgi:Tfp pilus assembly major pilin PilA
VTAIQLPPTVPDDATATALNVTVANATGDGFITVYPCGQPLPATSSANYVGITTVANNVITALGENRSVCIHTGQAAADVIVDLMGYYPATSSTTAVTPKRVFDTRNGVGPLGPGDTLVVPMAGAVPDDATTALLNVTAANATADGFITVSPCGRPIPATSNANFVGISTIANNVITAIGENRSVCIRTGQAAAEVIVDLVGYATD